MQPDPLPSSDRFRKLAFLGFVLVTVGLTTAYLLLRAHQKPIEPMPSKGLARPTSSQEPPLTLAALRKKPHLYYRSARPGEFGQVVVAALDAPETERFVTRLSCERMYFATGQGLCLREHPGALQAEARASFFKEDLTLGPDLELSGLPSRARVSPDGRYAASTIFVTGDDYKADFSTRTALYDVATQKQLADLESFEARRNGQRFRRVDFNYWGVTFAQDSDRFYATLATKGTTYLVVGSVARREIEVVREGAECPSLSPDGRHVAYKRRVLGTQDYRLHVLSLETSKELPLEGEPGSVDDQVEWLDSEHLLYAVTSGRGLPEAALNINVVGVGAASAERARRFIAGATSPCVVRGAPSPAHDVVDPKIEKPR